MMLFTTPLCSACFTIKNMLPETHKIKIIDLQANPSAINRYGILSVPTLIDDEGIDYNVPFDIITKIRETYAEKKD